MQMVSGIPNEDIQPKSSPQAPASEPPAKYRSGDTSVFNSISLVRFLAASVLVGLLLLFLVFYRIRESIPDPVPHELNWNYVSVVVTPLTLVVIGRMFYDYTTWERNRLERERKRKIVLNFLRLLAVLMVFLLQVTYKRWKHRTKKKLNQRSYFVGIKLITYFVIGILGIMSAKITNKVLNHGVPRLRRSRQRYSDLPTE